MGSNRTVRLALVGALAALITWIVSEPFARTAANHGVRAGSSMFSIGSFYGWFAHMTLGATIVGVLAFVVSQERMLPARACLYGLVATALGGFLGWFSDSRSDLLSIHLLRTSAVPSIFVHFLWSLFVCMSLALGVALCTQPTVARVTRILVGGMVAAVAVYFIRIFLSPITMLISMLQGGAAWQPFNISRLFEHLTIGFVLGACIGLGESLMTSARVRHVVGRNEGREFWVGGSVNRIGSAEGIEVPIFGDPTVAPVHAHLVQKDGRWWIQDAGSPTGVIVNGQRMAQSWLAGGETIQVGGSTLHFLLKGQNVPSMVYAPVAAPVGIPQASALTPTVASMCHRLVDPFGVIHDLPDGVVTVGRDEAATLSFPMDGMVSRFHAKVTILGAVATVEDTGSRNGTLVNGVPITAGVALNQGDTIQVGRTKLVYRCSSA